MASASYIPLPTSPSSSRSLRPPSFSNPPPISSHRPPYPPPFANPPLSPLPGHSRDPSSVSIAFQNWLSTYLPPSTLEFIERNFGLILVASAQIFFVGMGLSTKFFLATTEISTLLLILIRMFITSSACLVYLKSQNEVNWLLGPPELRRLLITRGMFGFGGLFSNYQSLRGLSLSDSVTIQFLAPNLTALAGFLVLGEILGWREVAAGLFCLGGVVLVSRPPFIFGKQQGVGDGENTGVGSGHRGVGGQDGWPNIPEEGNDAGIDHEDRIIAVCWALAAVLCSSGAYITIRKIGKRAHAMHSMLYFCYCCVLPCLLGLLFQISHLVFVKTWLELFLIILIGIFGFTGQMLLTFGLQREKAGRASLAMYLSLFYSLLFEFMIFHTIPPLMSLLGAGIIISSAVWVAMTKPEDIEPIRVKQEDEESQPFSRSPSPVKPGDLTIKREHYDYSRMNDSSSPPSNLKPGPFPIDTTLYRSERDETINDLWNNEPKTSNMNNGSGLRVDDGRRMPRRRSTGESGRNLFNQED